MKSSKGTMQFQIEYELATQLVEVLSTVNNVVSIIYKRGTIC